MSASGQPSPLHMAVMNGDDATLQALLANGASPDMQDQHGFTPLHLAAQQGSLHAAAALIEAGATVDAVNVHGNTPLFVAVFNSQGRGALIQLLRANGADPFHVNSSGQTPVGLAKLIANYDVARFFVDVEG